MKRTVTCKTGLAAIVLLGVLPLLSADQRPGTLPLTRQLQMNACYVKENTDREWHLRIVGDMPRGPGIYLIVYNEAGSVVQRAAVPLGSHTADKPFIVAVPADGKAQQYVIKVLGQQDNLNAMTLPLTDLPHEVYGDNMFSFGHVEGHRRVVSFQSPGSGQAIHLSGYKGDYRILDNDGRVVADSKDKVAVDPKGRNAQPEVKMLLTLPVGKTFWLEPYGVMYLYIQEGKLYLTFDPERWFEPKLTWNLESRPWWKGLVHE